MLQQLYVGAGQPATSVPGAAVLFENPANIYFNSTLSQPANILVQQQLSVSPSQVYAFTGNPSPAMLVDKPVVTAQGDIVYTSPLIGRAAAAHSAGGNVPSRTSNVFVSSHIESDLDSYGQAEPAMPAGCWPCEAKPLKRYV